jgi:phosphoketolase
MADTSVVRFPADANSALAALADCYRRQGEIHALVVPKGKLPVMLSEEQAQQLVDEGAVYLRGNDGADIQLVAIGAYQLQQCLLAWRRLEDRGLNAAVVCLLEPGRFRESPRDTLEAGCQAALDNLLPPEATRVVLAHTRPEAIRGLLPTGRATRVLGYRNRGGTLDVEGMLFANGCSWLHALATVAELTGDNTADWLTSTEQNALAGRIDPRPLLRVEEDS